jgi:hypothetical protein
MRFILKTVSFLETEFNFKKQSSILERRVNIQKQIIFKNGSFSKPEFNFKYRALV